jgi:DNA-binding protein HU-beta
MKKRDFIEQVAEKAEMSRSAAARTVEAIFDATEGVIVQALRKGEEVSLPGFGKFKSKLRAARKGRNPRTGKEIDIAERTVMQFSTGKSVSETLGGTRSGRKGTAKGAASKSAGAKTAGKSAGKGAGKSAGTAARGAAGDATKTAGAKSASKGAGTKAAKTAGASGAKSAAKGRPRT